MAFDQDLLGNNTSLLAPRNKKVNDNLGKNLGIGGTIMFGPLGGVGGFGLGKIINRIGNKRNRERQESFLRKSSMANAEGTGFLQESIPFTDIDSLVDPQRRLSLDVSTNEFDDRRKQLFSAFDTIRSKRGVNRSGFVDYAEQESLRGLARERQKTLFGEEQRFQQLTSSLQSRNDEVIARNRQKLFDVFGDKIYDSLKSLREKR